MQKKGRADGGIITWVRDTLEEEVNGEEDGKGVRMRAVKVGWVTCNLMTVYRKDGMGRNEERMEDLLGER